jgi:anaerobic selenocysteine-containing dehydrogenase
MKKEKEEGRDMKKEGTGSDTSRRLFMKNCGLVLLATTSYSVLSVFNQKPLGDGTKDIAQSSDCFEYCMSDCTGCTAGCTGNVIVPCNDCTSDSTYDIPDPGPPECVMYTDCQTECQSGCTYSCEYSAT